MRNSWPNESIGTFVLCLYFSLLSVFLSVSSPDFHLCQPLVLSGNVWYGTNLLILHLKLLHFTVFTPIKNACPFSEKALNQHRVEKLSLKICPYLNNNLRVDLCCLILREQRTKAGTGPSLGTAHPGSRVGYHPLEEKYFCYSRLLLSAHFTLQKKLYQTPERAMQTDIGRILHWWLTHAQPDVFIFPTPWFICWQCY